MPIGCSRGSRNVFIWRDVLSGTLKIRSLLHELSAIADRLERLENLVAGHGAVALAADRCKLLPVIYSDGKHARCLMDGLSGLSRSALAGHALDSEHAARHVSGDRVVAGPDEGGQVLGKEEKDDGQHRDSP